MKQNSSYDFYPRTDPIWLELPKWCKRGDPPVERDIFNLLYNHERGDDISSITSLAGGKWHFKGPSRYIFEWTYAQQIQRYEMTWKQVKEDGGRKGYLYLQENMLEGVLYKMFLDIDGDNLTKDTATQIAEECTHLLYECVCWESDMDIEYDMCSNISNPNKWHVIFPYIYLFKDVIQEITRMLKKRLPDRLSQLVDTPNGLRMIGSCNAESYTTFDGKKKCRPLKVNNIISMYLPQGKKCHEITIDDVRHWSILAPYEAEANLLWEEFESYMKKKQEQKLQEEEERAHEYEEFIRSGLELPAECIEEALTLIDATHYTTHQSRYPIKVIIAMFVRDMECAVEIGSNFRERCPRGTKSQEESRATLREFLFREQRDQSFNGNPYSFLCRRILNDSGKDALETWRKKWNIPDNIGRKKRNNWLDPNLKPVSFHPEQYPNATIDNTKYVSPFPNNFNTIILSAAMGKGKTTQIVSWLKNVKPSRILVLSPRKVFATNMAAEYQKEGISLVNYQDIDSSQLVECDKLIIQMESLCKLPIDCSPFDVIIIDESESCLKQFNSHSTMCDNIYPNLRAFENIMVRAKQCIMADAFITRRTIECATQLRLSHQLMVHKGQPEERESTEIKKKEDFFHHMFQSIKEGQKVYFVSASKRACDQFLEKYGQTIRSMGKKISYYSSERGHQQVEELKDVREAWSKVDVLITTATITVGVNYDLNTFDLVYMYGSTWGPTVRDMFQMHMRVRHISRRMLFYHLYTRPKKTSHYSKKGMVKRLTDKELLLQNAREKYRVTSTWLDTPTWVNEISQLNELEECATQMCYRTLFNMYLQITGYRKSTSTIDVTDLMYDIIQPSLATTAMDYNDIPQVEDERHFQTLLMMVHNDTSSKMERAMVNKAFFEKVLNRKPSSEQKREWYNHLWNDPKQRKGIMKCSRYKKCIDVIPMALKDEINEKKYIEYTSEELLEHAFAKMVCEKLELQHPLHVKLVERVLLEELHDNEELQKLILDTFKFRKQGENKTTPVNQAVKLVNKVLAQYGSKLVLDQKRRRKREKGHIVDITPFVVRNEGIPLEYLEGPNAHLPLRLVK